MVDGFANGNDISGTGEFSDRWNFFGNPSDFKPTPSGIPFFLSGTPNANDNPAAFAMNNSACLAHASVGALQSYGCY